MRYTTIQTNMLVLAIILAGLQAAILFLLEFNGGDGVIAQAVMDKDATVLALVFSPTGAITWALKRATGYTQD